jgi:anti-sigma factor RsiW
VTKRCDDVNLLVDAIAAGEEPDAEAASHIAGCARCTTALANAGTIERLLRDVPAAVVPAGFTSGVMSRIRRDRWRSEQVLDWTFNVAVSIGVLLIVLGLAGVAWMAGFISIGGDLMTVLSEQSPILLNRIARETQTILLAGLLLTTALGLWWWVESASV